MGIASGSAFGIFSSALNVVVGFVFRSIIVKFTLFFGLFFVVTAFIAILIPLLPVATSLQSALSDLPPSVWFFLDLCQIPVGLPIVLGAYVTRFIIRRIPVIG